MSIQNNTWYSNHKMPSYIDIVASIKKLIKLQSNKDSFIIVKDTPEHQEYVFDFNNDIVDHLHEIVNVQKNFLKQFVSLNQLAYLLRDFPTDIKVRVSISENSLFYLISNNMYRNHRIDIFELTINDSRSGFDMYLTNGHKKLSDNFDYNDAYEFTFRDIKSKLNTNIVDMKSFMHYLNHDPVVLIEKELNTVGISYIPHDCIPENYSIYKKVDSLNTTSIYQLDCHEFTKIVQPFFKKDVFKNFKQVLSVMQFYYRLEKLPSADMVNIRFSKIFKLQSHNSIFRLSNELDQNVTLELLSDGTFDFSNPILDVPVYLEDLNGVYTHYIELIGNKLSSTLKINPAEITIRELELYMMITY